MRDNFSEKVKRQLRDLVGNCCSNPDCKKSTTAHVNIGDAAHIKAASINGPRYDATQTKEERSSIENAIWLCKACAKMIDSDADNYPVEKLREWKRNAELRNQNNLNKPLYTFEETNQYALSQIAVMVGISKLDAPFKLAQFSQNIVQALHQEFKKLDPNIDIFPVIKHNGISFEVKGEIAVNVSVKGKKNYFAMKNLLDYGYMVSEIDGFIDFPSPAIKKMHEIQGIQLGEGKISIEPKNKLQCPTALIFKDKLNNEIWEIPTFANLYIGQKGFTINISLFNEIVTLTTEGVSFVEMKKGLSGKINLSINPNHILNKSIFELNSLESLVKFLRLLLEGNKPKIKIKSEHGELMSFSFSTTAQKIRNFIHRYFGDLNLILMLKTIAQYTNQNLEIRKNFGIDEKILNDIRNCYRAIQGNYSQECKPSNIIRFTLLKSHNLNDFNLKETHSIKIDQEFDNPLFIMEQNFNLPKIAHCFSAVKFHKTDNISSLDMDISVEMKPQKGCFYQLVLVK